MTICTSTASVSDPDSHYEGPLGSGPAWRMQISHNRSQLNFCFFPYSKPFLKNWLSLNSSWVYFDGSGCIPVRYRYISLLDPKFLFSDSPISYLIPCSRWNISDLIFLFQLLTAYQGAVLDVSPDLELRNNFDRVQRTLSLMINTFYRTLQNTQ